MARNQVLIFLAIPLAAVLSIGAYFLVPRQGDSALGAGASLGESALEQASSTAGAPFPSSVRVPILVYHIVRPAYNSDTQDVVAMRVTPEAFDGEMAHLAAAGYHVIPLSALEAYFASGTPLPTKPVVLTLDDAWESQYVYAFPVLKKYGYTATFFVPSGFPGNKSFMTWDQVRTLLSAGMTVGSHSATHPYLTRITSTSTLEAEIVGSKEKLEAELHEPIREFNYPFGAYTPQIVALVKAAGYIAARTDSYGFTQSADSIFMLSGINAPTTTAAFARSFP
jgi:peptidoglycan/xylan/chitin deacetylase (PgdA/CDA1 family)